MEEVACFLCGSKGWNVDMHHVSHNPDVTVPLCRSCHVKTHLETKPNDKRRYICPICGAVFWNFLYEHPKVELRRHKQWHVEEGRVYVQKKEPAK